MQHGVKKTRVISGVLRHLREQGVRVEKEQLVVAVRMLAAPLPDPFRFGRFETERGSARGIMERLLPGAGGGC